MNTRFETIMKSAKRMMMLFSAALYVTVLLGPLVVFAPPPPYRPPPPSPPTYRPPANDNNRSRSQSTGSGSRSSYPNSSGGWRTTSSSGPGSPSVRKEARQNVQKEIRAQIDHFALSRTRLTSPSGANQNQRNHGTTVAGGKATAATINQVALRKVFELAVSFRSKLPSLAAPDKLGDKSAIASGGADKSVAIDRSKQLASSLASGSKLREVFSKAAKYAQTNQMLLQKLANFASSRKAAARNTAIRWGPATGAGPLGAEIAATFRGGSYTQTVTTEDTMLYRVHGGKAGPRGSYWTRTPPEGPLQAKIDSALLPKWGNTAEGVSVIRVPKGTTIFEGFAAQQGNLVGGGNQVFLPKVKAKWFLK